MRKILFYNKDNTYTELNFFDLTLIMEICDHRYFRKGEISVVEQCGDLECHLKTWIIEDLTPMVIMKEIGRYFTNKRN